MTRWERITVRSLWEPSAARLMRILPVNATSVGLYLNVNDKPDVNYDTIKPNMTVSDVIFNDPHTVFLQEAERRGAKTINGLGMLVNQGAVNFTLWTGVEAPIDIMTQTLKNEFGLS
ncbi:hypothetical protein [Paenibacillus durus]|uniref:SDH C-terminal domain-containing protein n=1 Tax=Paenibacillus durus TaxID=44251 RepID=A0A089HJN5_PAEDU|nr:hypothetical protein [Paenibacillus durus]AIQ11312.1 hypothetical protein PDUR_04370 [Paenibacillus durus]